jgi:hypothetical protein
VGGNLCFEGRNGLHESIPKNERNLLFLPVPGQNGLKRAIPVKIVDIQRDRTVGIGVQAGVPSKIAGNEVRIPVIVEVGRGDPIPPAMALRKSLNFCAMETLTSVFEYRDRHPLADNDEIVSAVVRRIGPDGIRHHSDLSKFRGDLVGYVSEPACPVVLKEKAFRILPIVPGYHASPNE